MISLHKVHFNENLNIITVIIYLKQRVPRNQFAGNLAVQIHLDKIQAGRSLPAESQAGRSHLVVDQSRHRMDGIVAA